MVGLFADGMAVMGAGRAERQHSNILSMVQLYLPPGSTVKQATGQVLDLLEDSSDAERGQHITEEDAVMQEWQRIRMARVQCGF